MPHGACAHRQVSCLGGGDFQGSTRIHTGVLRFAVKTRKSCPMKARASRKPLGVGTPANSPLSGAELARQWAKADVFSPAFGGCMCAGGFHSPIDASAVAQDLLIYLEDKYRNSGQQALAQFVGQALGGARDFGGWLAGLDDAALEPQARALLIGDLQTTVNTMSGAPGFSCT